MIRIRVMFICFLFFLLSSLVNAGVGIRWEEESALIPEKSEGCLTYKVYNPWPEGETVMISLSDDIGSVLEVQGNEEVFVPAETPSDGAIPVEFCFEVPEVYEKDCLVGDFVCAQMCEEDMIVYEGDVLVSGVSSSKNSGSATKASVSAPIRVRVRCNESPRNYTLVYIIVFVVTLVGVLLVLTRHTPAFLKRKKKKR